MEPRMELRYSIPNLSKYEIGKTKLSEVIQDVQGLSAALNVLDKQGEVVISQTFTFVKIEEDDLDERFYILKGAHNLGSFISKKSAENYILKRIEPALLIFHYEL